MKLLILALLIFAPFARSEEMLTFGGMSVPKGIFDPPPGWKQNEKDDWAKSTCRFRVEKLPDIAGMLYFATDELHCFAEARFALIQIENKKMVKPENRQYLHQNLYAIFDNHAGFREVCRLVPLKDDYDFFEFTSMGIAAEAGGEKLREFISRLDENLHLECAMM
jgi:hypothetical protein